MLQACETGLFHEFERRILPSCGDYDVRLSMPFLLDSQNREAIPSLTFRV